MAKNQTTTGAHVKLSELVAFNEDLIKFRKSLNDYLTSINASISTLKQGWKDEKLVEYEQDFKKYKDLLSPLGDELVRYEQFMQNHWIPKIRKHLENKRKS